MPVVSIVIPTYRRAALLAGALDSVLAQTFTDFEVLVCDNGNEREVADLVARHGDPRLRYCPRETNVGMLPNALGGLRDAVAPFVMKLDDDDRLHPDALARLTAPLAAHPDVTMVFGRLRLVGPDGAPHAHLQAAYDSLAGRRELAEGYYRPFGAMAARGTTNLAGAMVRRDTLDLERFPLEVATAYDLFICLCAAADSAAAYFVDAPVVDYMVHPKSDTATNAARQLRGQVAALDHASASGRYADGDLFQVLAAEACVRLGRELLRAGETREARSVLSRAQRTTPSAECAKLLAVSMTPARLGKRVMGARAAAYQAREAALAGPSSS